MADFDAKRLPGQSFERRVVTSRRPQLQLRVAGGPQLQQIVVAAIVKFEPGDGLGVAAIEAFGQPQDRRERAYCAAGAAPEIGEAVVLPLGRRLAMVAGDERDDGDIQPVEPEYFGIENQIFRMLVVGARADVSADFMQNGGHLEQQRVVRRELMEIRERFEKTGAQVPDVFAVAGVRLIAFRENAGGAEDFLGEGSGEFL